MPISASIFQEENGTKYINNELIELTIQSKYSVQFRSQYCRVEKLIISHVNLIDLIVFCFIGNKRFDIE